MPIVMRKVRDDTLAARDQYWTKRLEAAGLPSLGGPGTHVDMSKEPKQGGEAIKKIREQFAKL